MLKKMLLIGLTAGVLSGCSLWGGSDEIEPNPLVDFTAEKQFVVKWSVQVGDGPGKAYHQMTPAVTSERVFAADREGLVVAVDSHAIFPLVRHFRKTRNYTRSLLQASTIGIRKSPVNRACHLNLLL
jgi:outer membrane protein assembly factor BamB